MGHLLTYSVTTSIVLALMWLVYRTFLSDSVRYTYNRRVLLSIYAVAATTPLLIWLSQYIRSIATTSSGMTEIGMPVMAVIPDGDVSDSPISWTTLLLDVYLCGTAIMATGFLLSVIRLIVMRLKYGMRREYGCLVIIHGNRRLSPFSWFRWVFVNRRDHTDPDFAMILMHERGHITLHHWIDLIIAQTAIVLQWYNPAAWIMRSDLQDIHEYQADEYAVTHGIELEKYQLFIIKKTVGARFASLANSLNHSSLKKRITMMLSNKTRARSRMRVLALVPVAAIAVAAMSTDFFATAADMLSAARPGLDFLDSKVNENPSNGENASPQAVYIADMAYNVSGTDDKVFDTAEKSPQFPGGEAAMIKFMIENVRYPEAAAKANIQGRVIVQFVVDKSGKVRDAKVMRSVSPELDAEALRVIMSMPDFTPGEIDGRPVSVHYMMPVSFKLQGDSPKEEKPADNVSAAHDVVLTAADKMPQYPGGEVAMMKFLAENIRYPETAMKAKTQGRVVVKFIIDKNTGKVTEPTIMRSVSPELDAEALRVISSMPAFTPGEVNGKPVSVYYTLPVSFKLD